MTGFVIGFGLGLVVGILWEEKTVGREHKPWSELTEKKRKIEIGIMVGLALLVVAGGMVLFSVR